jgi:hypothetical protein
MIKSWRTEIMGHNIHGGLKGGCRMLEGAPERR